MDAPSLLPHLTLVKMLQLAPFNRVPFGKCNRASAFPVACCGVSERTTIKWIHSLHFEDSLQLAAGSFNSSHREIPFALQGISLGIKRVPANEGCLPEAKQQTIRRNGQ